MIKWFIFSKFLKMKSLSDITSREDFVVRSSDMFEINVTKS